MSDLDIGGSISIDTSSLDKALATVRKLESTLSKASDEMLKSTTGVDRALSNQVKQFLKLESTSKKATLGDATKSQIRMETALAKATNTMGAYEAQVNKANLSDREREKFLTQGSQALNQYAKYVAKTRAEGVQFAQANVVLGNSLSQLRRELTQAREAGSQGIVDTRALDNAAISYDKATNAVRTSALEDDKKQSSLNMLKTRFEEFNRTLQQHGSRSVEAVKSQGALRRAVAQSGIEVQNANKAFKGAELASLNQKFRNLTSSVVVALGPLSGVASRLIALQGLFNRNAASVAAVLAGVTAFTVSLARARTYAIEAERQFFAIDATIANLGHTANFTSQEIFDMGHRLADATLLSAQEARAASTALLQFGNLTTEQFERTIVAAQGITSALGGRLRENVKLLGRVMQDPVDSISELERRGVQLDDTTKNLITTMVQQGRTLEANNLLLEQLASFEAAARNEANSLAGAMDAVSGNIDKLYENTFIASGALEEAKVQTKLFADALLELSTSDAAARIGAMFKGMVSGIGTAANFILDNLQFLTAAIVVLASSVVPRFIVTLYKLTTAMVGLNLTKAKSVAAATAQGTAYNTVTRSTVQLTAAQRALNVVMASNPWGLIAGAMGAALFYFSDHIFKASELRTTIKGLDQDYKALSKTLMSLSGNPEAQELGESIAANLELRNSVESRIDATERQLRVTQAAIKKNQEEVDGITFVSRLTKEGAAIRLEAVSAGLQLSRQEAELLAELQRLNNELEETAIGLDRLMAGQEGVAEAAREQEKAMQHLTTMQERFNSLIDTTDPKVKTIKEEIDKLKNAFIGLGDAQDGIFDQEQIDAYITRLNQLYTEYAEATQPKKRSRDKTDNTSALDNMIKQFKDTAREAELLELKIMGVDSAVEEFVRNNKIADFSEEVAKLSRDHLVKLAQSLGVVNAQGMSQSQIINNVTDAYKQQIITIDELNKRFSADTAAQEWRKSQLTGVDAIRAKYQELFDTVFESGDSQILADVLTAEREEINKHIQAVREQWTWKQESELEALTREYQARKELIRTELAGEKEIMIQHLDELEQEYQKKKFFMQFHERAAQGMDALSAAMDMMSAANRQNTKEFQVLAAAQTIMAGSSAIMKTWQGYAELGPFGKAMAIAQIGMISAQMGASLAAIRSQSFADGGLVRGAGGSRDDKVPANLSPNEFVINAAAVRKIGLSNLYQMNQGIMPRNFADGGTIMPIGVPSASNGGSNVVIQILDQRTGDTAPVETTETVDSEGVRRVQVIVRDAMKREFSNGSMDGVMANRYGTVPKGVRR